ncbi:hypothetical protein MTR67_042497 [Solanum verrucosum]|uniref:GDSL esterase/lipase n=1 Tax=Solanum verrucosum TaxID=315347 RepID=A0AAF0ZR68_SOLVR|nr:hypothetical protein MTR67_042497 [Solanum verrucosum]
MSGLYSFIILILIFFMLEAPILIQAQSKKNSLVSAIFIFGDSTADPGNNNYISTPFKSNFSPYGKDFLNHVPTGRFTNGMLANDFIARYVGVKEYVPPYLDQNLSIEELKTGVSFASAGTGFDPLTPKISIHAGKSHIGGKALPNKGDSISKGTRTRDLLVSHPVFGTHIGVRVNSDLRRKVPHWGKALPNKDDSIPKGTRTRDLLGFLPGVWYPYWSLTKFGFTPGSPTLGTVISLSKQIEYFKEYQEKMEAAIGKEQTQNLIKEALFIISAGTNDYVVNYNTLPIRSKSYTLSSYTDFLLQHVQLFLQKLVDQGARRIGMVGLPPMGCLPIVITLNSDNAFSKRNCIEFYSSIARDYNSKLQNKLNDMQIKFANLGSRFAYLDIYGPLMDMIVGHKYDFEKANYGCCGTGLLEGAFLCNPSSYVCKNASNVSPPEADPPGSVRVYVDLPKSHFPSLLLSLLLKLTSLAMAESSDEAIIEKLYEYGERLNEAKDKSQNVEDYENIIKAAKSSSVKAMQLAAQLIPRFFKYFPSLSVRAVDAQLDFCEAEELGVRVQAIRGLPLFCKDTPEHLSKIVDILVQLLTAEENVERDAVNKALLSLLRQDVEGVLSLTYSVKCHNLEHLLCEENGPWAQPYKLSYEVRIVKIVQGDKHPIPHPLIAALLLRQFDFLSVPVASLTALFKHIETIDEQMSDDNLRERTLVFIKDKVFPLKAELLKPPEKMERHITDLIKKSLQDVTGGEFKMFMDFLRSLSIFGNKAPQERVQELIEIISGQADLDAQFNVSDGDHINRLIACLFMAIPFFERGASNSKFLNYLNKHIFPVFDKLPEERKVDLLKNLAESAPYTIPQDSRQILPSVVQLLKASI